MEELMVKKVEVEKYQSIVKQQKLPAKKFTIEIIVKGLV